jgi:DNA-binding winged helix-turn-helix (wHTH) protein
MQPAPAPERILQFEEFELNLRSGELSRDGRRIRLQLQPFRILEILLEQPCHLVTREELRERLWPKDTFVDFDHSLNTAIKKLREALSDEANKPRFIETLPRRGYRFIGTLTETGRRRRRSKRSGLSRKRPRRRAGRMLRVPA